MFKKQMRNTLLFALLAVILIAFVRSLHSEQIRPNIVMIVVDDLRFDEIAIGGHPYIETPNIDRLGKQGVIFTNAYHSTPLCSPNRACLLTGQYVSRHGILDNTSRSRASHQLDLFPKALQKAGYRTAHIGKWHMGNDPTPRPGYDYWVSFSGQGKTNDPDLYEGGRTHPVKGYITDIFTDRAVGFIKSTKGKPFFVYIGHKAVHPEAVQLDDGTVDLSVPRNFIPAERHRGRYDGKVVERRPNYGFTAEDALGKPVIKKVLEIRSRYEKDEDWAREIDPGISENTIRRRAEMMLAVDESVGCIYEALREKGQLANTLIIFTSDNGYFYGEHGLTVERRLPYEESIRTPLLMHWPKVIKPGSRAKGLTTSIDIAPTITEAAGIGIPSRMQGKSQMPVIIGRKDKVHDSIMIEYYSHENPFPWTAQLDYRVVRKGPYKYIRWMRFEDQAELYDLVSDPFEQKNLINDPTKVEIIEEMKTDLRRLTLKAMGLDR
jgi:arylsulfatase A-like enzyme